MSDPAYRQTFYRLAQGVTCVPDGAPTDYRWHSLDNAIRDVQAWIRESGYTGPYIYDTDVMTINVPLCEVRVVEVADLPPNIDPCDSESDASGGCPYVARVCARIYVERRFYREERKRATGIVDGVPVEGYGAVERIYVTDWSSAWRKSGHRIDSGTRAYSTVAIPIVRDEIVWADREVGDV